MEEENNIKIKELERFEWMTLKIYLLPLLMQETDSFIEKYISKSFLIVRSC